MGTWPPTAKLCFAIGHAEAGRRQPGRDCAAYPAGPRELGLETVAVYSQADEEALPVQLATQAVCIGPARASESYLNQEAILTVARATGCDGIHPGYGFLSENGEFADACAREGLAFVGPSGEAIRRAGSKSAAKTLMKQAGVPVTPGSDGPVDDVEAARAAAAAVGYPVLLKASAGGGGRGIRRVYREEELQEAFESARPKRCLLWQWRKVSGKI